MRLEMLRLRQTVGKMLALTTMPLLTITSSAIAVDSPAFPDPKNSCICDPQDPFDPQAQMPSGPFKGVCVNSCEQRTAKILSPIQAAPYNPKPGTIAIANVSHKGKFWVAQVPVNGVQDAIYQIEQMFNSCPLCHSQLRFRFKPGSEVILVPQSLSESPTEVRLSDLVYSIEATGTPGAGFNPAGALANLFGLSFRLVSLEDRAQRMIIVDKHKVEQIRLALRPEEKQKLLKNAMLQADRSGMKFMYSFYDRNCTTELFKVIDSSVSYGGSRKKPNASKEPFFYFPTGTFMSKILQKNKLNIENILTRSQQPEIQKVNQLLRQTKHPREALRERGLNNNTSKMISLNDEIKKGLLK
ncbi:lipoprotein N-acyltransferase Lnb domain-containing protein [Chroococcidiopsis cubana]|nr:DUF4105 domain-containing protein [Chroococcidiopsis cubana]